MSECRIDSMAAVLLVRNIVSAVAYYRDQLGFSCGPQFGEPPSFAIVSRDGMSLMLKQADDPRHVVPHWTVSPKLCNVYFWVTNVDALHREMMRRGATIDYGPCDQPHGCREFGIQDVDGYDIAFGEKQSS